jgi:hypothetical protein
VTSGGFDEPTRADFDQAMDQLAHDKLEQMMIALREVGDIFIRAGGVASTRYAVTGAQGLDRLFRELLVEAAERTALYVGRLGDPRLLATYLRPHLEWLRDRALDQIPEAMNTQTALYNHYKAEMTPRLNAVLRDLEIGVVNGRMIARNSDEIFQLKPALWGISINLWALWRAITGRRGQQ